MIIKLLIEGGNMTPGPTIAQKIGPLGLNMGKIIQDVNQATHEFKGLKVPVELDINSKAKTYQIKVASPPTSELIKKEIGISKASGEHKKLKVGNLAIEQIVKIAKTKHQNMLDKELKSAVKSVVGSCVSLGVLIENEEAKLVEEQISSGKYSKEIQEGKTSVPEEKAKKLKEFFDNLKKKQEAIIKKEEEEKAAEEAKKAEEIEKAPQKAAETKEEKKEEKPKK